MINLYESKTRANWIVLAIGFLIGTISIIYTNALSQRLVAQEERQINIFARLTEFIPQADEKDLDFLLEISDANHDIPFILTDEKNNPIEFKNLVIPENVNEKEYLKIELEKMKAEHPPKYIKLDETGWHQNLYYRNSNLVRQLKYFPYVLLGVILIFFVLMYVLFNANRKSEQNRVWVGLAKETAHQLGTPLSSLIAWIEFFKADDALDDEIISELEKDIKRLEMITERFSSIGSLPTLKNENIESVVRNVVNYLQKRISTKIKINIDSQEDVKLGLNVPLFEWVIENLCKNAVDAIGGNAGQIDILIRNGKDEKTITLDILDTGKGIAPSKLKKVFDAGFTTKKRGWGLGLALVKRIIEDYHNGKIFVLKSEIDLGTTFRIVLPK